jgi:hypothetical protein
MTEQAIRRSRLGASRSGNKKQTQMYKIWRSKQNSGFCGTRVQVGLYLGTQWPDKRCPNCCRRETAAHHLLCSNEDRTQLLINNTDKLGHQVGYSCSRTTNQVGPMTLTLLPCLEEHARYLASNQSSINGFFTKKRPHPAAIVSLLKSNKRLRKPD